VGSPVATVGPGVGVEVGAAVGVCAEAVVVRRVK
jgi:hypothetical protein